MTRKISEIKEQNEKRCILCNKPYNYKYQMFGRGCVDNLYDLLKIAKTPRIIANKELYLCTRIAWKDHKFFLSRSKKYNLAQKYIALNYLNRINLPFLDDNKEKISKDINAISIFSKDIVESIPFKLNDVYQAFNSSQKFDEIMNKLKNIDFEKIDEKIAKGYIRSLSFIFDLTKKSNPISYGVFYSMQYVFWQVVVAGGILTNKKLAAMLLLNSLSPFGKKPNDISIESDEISKLITTSKSFKNGINQLIKKYGQDKEEFVIADNALVEDKLIRFDNSDLLYALHDATMLVKAYKNNENKWEFEIKIMDTYDFTDFKDLKEYADSKDDKLTDIFSTLLNNLGVVSSEYGVINTYNVTIKLKTKEGEF